MSLNSVKIAVRNTLRTYLADCITAAALVDGRTVADIPDADICIGERQMQADLPCLYVLDTPTYELETLRSWTAAHEGLRSDVYPLMFLVVAFHPDSEEELELDLGVYVEAIRKCLEQNYPTSGSTYDMKVQGVLPSPVKMQKDKFLKSKAVLASFRERHGIGNTNT